MRIYFDGGCKPNPGIMEICVVADGKTHIVRDLGHGTNNEAEWLALLYALKVAEEVGDHCPDIYGDSLLVINQALGEWKCKHPNLIPFREEFLRLQERFAHVELTQVKRAKNLAGLALEQ